MKKIVLGIDGMKCGMCEAHINNICRGNPSVKSVKSSHIKNSTVIVSRDDSFDVENLKRIIEGDGYRVISQKEEPYEKKAFFAFIKK